MSIRLSVEQIEELFRRCERAGLKASLLLIHVNSVLQSHKDPEVLKQYRLDSSLKQAAEALFVEIKKKTPKLHMPKKPRLSKKLKGFDVDKPDDFSDEGLFSFAVEVFLNAMTKGSAHLKLLLHLLDSSPLAREEFPNRVELRDYDAIEKAQKDRLARFLAPFRGIDPKVFQPLHDYAELVALLEATMVQYDDIMNQRKAVTRPGTAAQRQLKLEKIRARCAANIASHH